MLGTYEEVIPYCQNNNISEIICSADKLSKEVAGDARAASELARAAASVARGLADLNRAGS